MFKKKDPINPNSIEAFNKQMKREEFKDKINGLPEVIIFIGVVCYLFYFQRNTFDSIFGNPLVIGILVILGVVSALIFIAMLSYVVAIFIKELMCWYRREFK